MRITSKGQVTIPARIREQAGMFPNTEVEFVLERGSVRLVRAKPRKGGSRRERLLHRLEGSATVRMTTDEIMALTRKP
ncbi:MAG: AbrB/MazE/SpoVT family DNA-binding domain-containing protein [Bdellovibrionota bacterium]